MKIWWLTKGWPWLKENWWVLLLLPLLLLTGLTIVLYDLTRSVQVVDPLREADARARREAEARAQALQAEKERLEAELSDIRSKYQELEDKFAQRLADEVEVLRNDPEKLRQAMLAAGRGK
jgi:hypothetical protein